MDPRYVAGARRYVAGARTGRVGRAGSTASMWRFFLRSEVRFESLGVRLR
jgi:hypothetical protein